MKTKKISKNQKGQGLAEMIISIPVLFLFAAAIIQFSVLFLSFVQFEHACGEGAREYAAGLCSKTSLAPVVFENLGSFKRFFDPKSIQAALQDPKSNAAGALDKLRGGLGVIPFLVNYDGAEWSISARCRPPFLFHIIFPDGILFHTLQQVYRYPK